MGSPPQHRISEATHLRSRATTGRRPSTLSTHRNSSPGRYAPCHGTRTTQAHPHNSNIFLPPQRTQRTGAVSSTLGVCVVSIHHGRTAVKQLSPLPLPPFVFWKHRASFCCFSSSWPLFSLRVSGSSCYHHRHRELSLSFAITEARSVPCMRSLPHCSVPYRSCRVCRTDIRHINIRGEVSAGAYVPTHSYTVSPLPPAVHHPRREMMPAST